MGGDACDDVFDWAAREPDRAMFAAKAGGAWQPVTAERFAGRVTAVTAGFATRSSRKPEINDRGRIKGQATR